MLFFYVRNGTLTKYIFVKVLFFYVKEPFLLRNKTVLLQYIYFYKGAAFLRTSTIFYLKNCKKKPRYYVKDCFFFWLLISPGLFITAFADSVLSCGGLEERGQGGERLGKEDSKRQEENEKNIPLIKIKTGFFCTKIPQKFLWFENPVTSKD